MVFSITQYAQLAGISASTIRYYEDEGLLPKAERRGGSRIYYPQDVPRLKLLIVARKAGFGIKAIKQMLEQNKTAGLPMKNTVVVAAQARVHAIEQEIEVLQKQRQLLTDAKMCSCIDLSKCSMFG